MAPNRREEIKRKQELQAKFQFSIAQNNNLALNWLKPKKQVESEAEQPTDDTQNEFLKLKVIPSGKSLASAGNKVQTVGDFLNSRDINNLKDTSNNQNNETDKNNAKNGGSIAMNALLNKMRNENRSKLNNNHKPDNYNNSTSAKKKKSTKSSSASSQAHQIDSDSDSDSDREARKSRSVKTNLKVNKVGKKGARPF
ncbi:uncharacterized protein KGF55_005783 [Candida pseudojiufengensis]|uniref:uncharacterized protein n=1 Tax=Candida pseudojiufengensis TaxID=497109 RepID=UPI0022255323|nr:uncharacterized protein KGF55_005783 [Candida pseudojiufengensis]KAI5958523.1 hypothetical protein KGF55_005783 [Candida pseudojiufengensis]